MIERKHAHLFFGYHDQSHVDHLNPFFEHIVATANFLPEGKRLAILLEDGSTHYLKSRQITSLTSSGWLPTEAYASNLMQKFGSPLPTRDTVREKIAEGKHHSPDTFTRNQYQQLDILWQEGYGDRLLLVPEMSRDVFFPELHYANILQRTVHRGIQGNFDPDMFSYAIYQLKRKAAKRTQLLAAQMKQVSMRHDVSGIASYMGVEHSSIAIHTRSSNLAIVRSFSGAEKGVYIKTPLESLDVEKAAKIADERGHFLYMSPEESKVVLAQTVIWDRLSRQAKQNGKVPEQQVKKAVWRATKHFTSADADAFASAISQNGIQSAIKEVFSRTS